MYDGLQVRRVHLASENLPIKRVELIPSITATAAFPLAPRFIEVDPGEYKTVVLKTDEGGVDSASVFIVDEGGIIPRTVADVRGRGITLGRGSGLTLPMAGLPGFPRKFRIYAVQSASAATNVLITFFCSVFELPAHIKEMYEDRVS